MLKQQNNPISPPISKPQTADSAAALLYAQRIQSAVSSTATSKTTRFPTSGAFFRILGDPIPKREYAARRISADPAGQLKRKQTHNLPAQADCTKRFEYIRADLRGKHQGAIAGSRSRNDNGGKQAQRFGKRQRLKDSPPSAHKEHRQKTDYCEAHAENTPPTSAAARE